MSVIVGSIFHCPSQQLRWHHMHISQQPNICWQLHCFSSLNMLCTYRESYLVFCFFSHEGFVGK